MRGIYIIIFLFCAFSSRAQNYIIGDSQSYFISKRTHYAKLLPALVKSGIGVSELIQMAQSVKEDPNAKTLFLSIGVNDSYVDRGINQLIKILNSKFPNAQIIVVQGSYAWGNLDDITPTSSKYVGYYNTFRKAGIFVIDISIGYGDPHSDRYEYEKIAGFIDYIIYKNWKRDQKQG